MIEFQDVYKTYRLYSDDKKRFIGMFNKKVKCVHKIATNYLTFKINNGEKVAFLGTNGAGKSTILKMITNVCYPNSGNIKVEGKVGALLELSSGFDAEFSGRENIYLKCNLLGMKKNEVDLIIDKIIEFADIGPYIDQPIRTYSSGMKARLGFAIIINSNCDILVVDEALAVGDKAFQQKCLDKIKEASNNNVTLLLVTHSLTQASQFCNRGIVLNKGHLVYDAEIEKAIYEYGRLLK